MQGTKVMHIFVRLKEVHNESKQCKYIMFILYIMLEIDLIC